MLNRFVYDRKLGPIQRAYMTIFNVGSINIDHVYQVPHFVRPGETMTSNDYQKLLGGKGANQSIALAQANCPVVHIGAISGADQDLLATLAGYGIDTNRISLSEQATGHAIIQVNNEGENAIVLFAGANRSLSLAQVAASLDAAQTNDWVLLQNETNLIVETIDLAKERGLAVAFNPAPMDAQLVKTVIDKIDLLVVNEVEIMDLFATDSIEQAQNILQQQYPLLTTIITLGAQGARHVSTQGIVDVVAFKVDAIDTTAAGDTFIGYCLAGLASDLGVEQTLRQACAASAICVTGAGASVSIPAISQVSQFLEEQHHDT